MTERYSALHCGNCEFALVREIDQESVRRAHAGGVTIPELHCRRNPAAITKRRDDWCGEHSEAIVLRDRELADMVAIGVVKQLHEPTAREAVIDRLRPRSRN